MAETLDIIYYDHKLECPICHTGLLVQVESEVKRSSARAGSSTFNHTDPVLSVEYEAKKIKIHHECVYTKSKD